jgi:hypothetical protein
MASAEVYNLVEFYYFSASEIRPAKMDGLWWEWPYKKGLPYSQNVFVKIYNF